MGGEYSHEVTCDGCGHYIKGYCYKCRTCVNTQYCTKCFDNSSLLHLPHYFDRMWKPNEKESTHERKVGVQRMVTQAPAGFSDLSLLAKRRQQLRAYGPMNILLFGERGIGKTAFVNAVNSAFQDDAVTDIKCVDRHGASMLHHTRIVRCHDIDAKSQVKLYDVWGWSEDLDFVDDGVLPYLLQGHMKDGFKIEDKKTMHAGAGSLWNANPTKADGIHAVIVMTQRTHRNLYLQQVQAFMKRMNEYDIPFVVVLNKVDELDSSLSANPGAVYSSLHVQRQLGTWRDNFETDVRDIFPMKGYEHEKNRNKHIDLMALDVLYAAAEHAALHLEKHRKYPAKPGAGIGAAAAGGGAAAAAGGGAAAAAAK